MSWIFELQGHLKRLRAAAGNRPGDRGSAVRRLLKCEAGGTLVEFALSISLVIMMMFAVIEFSFALYSYHFVNEVARNLSRYAMVRGSSCTAMPNCGFTDSGATLQTYARATFIYPGVNSGQLNVTSTWYSPSTTSQPNPTWTACGSGAGCNKPGYMVQVTVTYPFFLSIPFWKSRTLNVSTSSRMIISQ